MTISLEALTPYAQRLTQSPQNENARSNLVLRLQLATDVDTLLALAACFVLNPEVSIPVWRRLADILPNDKKSKLNAAYVFYGNGLDSEALKLVDDSLSLDENYIPAWELKAALCSDGNERRQIFEHILKLEPGNRCAVDNLIILGRPNT